MQLKHRRILNAPRVATGRSLFYKKKGLVGPFKSSTRLLEYLDNSHYLI